MRKILLLALLTWLFSASAQVGRIELLTRSSDHPVRRGASGDAVVPEISADGRYILFISPSVNLLTNFSPSTFNLYMVDRQTGATTLISQGVDGQPANNHVDAFQFSANARRILFETRASNLAPNDTNNSVDVFVRDLDSHQTILVTVATNGHPAVLGGSDAGMSADGNRVVFNSRSPDLAAKPSYSILDVYVRDVAARRTEIVSVPKVESDSLGFSRFPSISDDGNIVAFYSSKDLIHGTFDFSPRIYVRNLAARTLVRADPTNTAFFGPLLSADGRFVVPFSTLRQTNVLTRFHVQTAQHEIIASNANSTLIQPVAISSDGTTIVYVDGHSLFAWREGEGSRQFPRDTNGAPIDPLANFATLELSADGQFATFMAEAPGLVHPPARPGLQPYLYNIATDSLTLLSPPGESTGVQSDSPSYPIPNSDGSAVVFSAVVDTLDEQAGEPVANLYVWTRSTQQSTRLTKGIPGYFQNTDRDDSSHPKDFALSDDGSKLVYASLAPATDVLDTNNNWDIFVLDRRAAIKTTISVTADGLQTGNSASFQPIISGNGNVVAFFSRATNLVSSAFRPLTTLYVRNLTNGSTRAILTLDGAQPRVSSPTLSRDGGFLAFETTAPRLDARDTNAFSDIFKVDLATGAIALVSYNATGTTAGNQNSTDPSISPDGSTVAFRTRASNLGLSGFVTSDNPFLLRLSNGQLRNISPSGQTVPNFPRKAYFNRAGSRLLFPGLRYNPLPIVPTFYSYDFTTNGVSTVCADCLDVSISENGRYVAFTRATGLGDIFLLDRVTQEQSTIIQSAARPVSFLRVTDDGRFVIFQSHASNLLTNDLNNTVDVFAYDRADSRLKLVSANRQGTSANNASQRPVLASTGEVLFKSYAADLVQHDLNDSADIFVVHLPELDRDNDQLSDRWETNFFNDLSRNGLLDSDSDGLTDAMEFQAGSDPTLATSALKLTSVTPASNGELRLQWSAIPGRSYRIQVNTDLNTNLWQDFLAPIVASRTDMTLNIPSPANAQNVFVRILLAE